MDTLLLRHVAEIAVSDIDKPEEALKEIAKTYADRNMTAAKGFAATAASILTATVLPVFAKSQTTEDVRVILVCGILIFSCAVIFFAYARKFAVPFRALLLVTDTASRLETLARHVRKEGFLRRMLGRWMKDVLPTFKLSTRSQYSYFMRKYLVSYFGEQPLEDIRPEEVQQFFAQCKRLAPKTVRSMATALSSSFRTAVNWGFVEVNPVRGIMLPPKRTVRPRRALTPKEVQDLLAHLEEPCRMIVVLILLTGMRIGEVLAMRWGKIDWKNRTIQVDEGVYEGELSTPKTESAIRSLPMSKVLFAELQSWHGKRFHDPAEFVFHTAAGTPHCRRNLMHRQMEPAALSAGIGAVGWHTLRRTHSTWLKDAGAAPTVIQHQLGHADPRLAFELYVMSIPGERRKAVERVSTQLKRLLDPNSTHRPAKSQGRGSVSVAVSAG